MKNGFRVLLLGFLALISVMMFMGGCTAQQDKAARKQRTKVKSLVKLGDDFDEAQAILKKNGFKLLYDKPIKPSYKKDYQQQIVIIGNTNPNTMETISYVTKKKMPGTRKESPYVVINASLDGKIIKIK